MESGVIAHVTGKLIQSTPHCLVMVGGVGFEVNCPERDRLALANAAGEVSFHTYLYVREDRLTLFGFLRSEDRELFTKLIDVSGVGPKVALAVMGEHSAERIVRAIVQEDHGFLCKVPGLGRKTAERLTVDLKDKLKHLAAEPEHEEIGAATLLREEAVLALTSLGMQRGAAERALEKIDWTAEESTNLEVVIKNALKLGSGV